MSMLASIIDYPVYVVSIADSTEGNNAAFFLSGLNVPNAINDEGGIFNGSGYGNALGTEADTGLLEAIKSYVLANSWPAFPDGDSLAVTVTKLEETNSVVTLA